MAPCFGPLVANFAPTLKLSHRGGVVGMGREPFDESIEGPIGKIGVVAPRVHCHPQQTTRRIATWDKNSGCPSPAIIQTLTRMFF